MRGSWVANRLSICKQKEEKSQTERKKAKQEANFTCIEDEFVLYWPCVEGKHGVHLWICAMSTRYAATCGEPIRRRCFFFWELPPPILSYAWRKVKVYFYMLCIDLKQKHNILCFFAIKCTQVMVKVLQKMLKRSKVLVWILLLFCYRVVLNFNPPGTILKQSDGTVILVAFH